jgi:hypothetical protein
MARMTNEEALLKATLILDSLEPDVRAAVQAASVLRLIAENPALLASMMSKAKETKKK